MSETNLPDDKSLEYGVEKERSRSILTADYLQSLASSENEMSVHIYEQSIKILKGKPDEVQHIPRFGDKPLFMLHSHPKHGGDQPSIADLNSAELYQLYSDMPDLKLFIFTVRGITEYGLTSSLVSHLSETDDEFREYYSDWLKKTFGEEKPDGKTISTRFNEEHNTSTFYPWQSEKASQLVEDFRTKKRN